MEKPLDSDLQNIEVFNNLVNENKLVVMMAYVFRFSPLIKKVKDLITNNVIGKVYFARGEFSEYLPDWHPYEDYRSFYMSEKKLGGGSILDQSHIMDLIHFLLGDFEEAKKGFTDLVEMQDLPIEIHNRAKKFIELSE